LRVSLKNVRVSFSSIDGFSCLDPFSAARSPQTFNSAGPWADGLVPFFQKQEFSFCKKVSPQIFEDPRMSSKGLLFLAGPPPPSPP